MRALTIEQRREWRTRATGADLVTTIGRDSTGAAFIALAQHVLDHLALYGNDAGTKADAVLAAAQS